MRKLKLGNMMWDLAQVFAASRCWYEAVASFICSFSRQCLCVRDSESCGNTEFNFWLQILCSLFCVMCVCVLSRVRLFTTLWTLAHQAPLSMGFSRQEDWSGLPCPPPGDLADPGIKLEVSWIGRWILYHWATWEAPFVMDHSVLAQDLAHRPDFITVMLRGTCCTCSVLTSPVSSVPLLLLFMRIIFSALLLSELSEKFKRSQ